MPVKCPHCQATNKDMAKFCDRCGQPLIDLHQKPVAPVTEESESRAPLSSAAFFKSALAVILFIGATIGTFLSSGLLGDAVTRDRFDPTIFLTILGTVLLVWLLKLVSPRSWVRYFIFMGVVFFIAFQFGAYESLGTITPVGLLYVAVSLLIFFTSRRGKSRFGRGSVLTGKRYKRKDVYYGRVTDLQKGNVSRRGGNLEKLSFRLQETDVGFREFLVDAKGNLFPALQVEVYAKLISDAIKDGDKVEIHGRVRGRLLPKKIINHSLEKVEVTIKGQKKID